MSSAAPPPLVQPAAMAQADRLRRFVNGVSHRQGATLSQMEEAGVTLPQVLVMARVQAAGAVSISDLAKDSPSSSAAMSQMVDRLVRRSWLSRCEDAADRRRSTVALTDAGAGLLSDLERARALDYAAGLAQLSPDLRATLDEWLDRALAELDCGGPP